MQAPEILREPVKEAFRPSFFMDLRLEREAAYHESVLGRAPAVDRMRREVGLGDAATRARHQMKLHANRVSL